MTVSSTQNRVSFAGNGVTTSFGTTPVVFFDTSDLAVYAVTDATGVSVTLVEGTDYTVSGGSGAVGTVNTAGGSAPYGAPATGITLLIVRTLPLTQLSDFVNNEKNDADVAEAALDRLVMIAQQLATQIDRSFVLADSDTSGASTTLPTPAASKLIGWNDTATALQNYAAADIGLTIASAFVLTLLDDATGSAFLTTLRNALSAGTLDVADEIAFYDVSAVGYATVTVTNLLKIINSLTADTLPDPAADWIMTYDTSAATVKKTKVRNMASTRQTVLSSAVDSSGYAAGLTTGSGLRPGLDASPTPMVLTSAAGFDEYGAIDYIEKFSADVADPLGADLSASNTAFIYRTLGSAWGSCKIPPQYGYAFDRTQGALLNFEGANASTSMIDDFGNTWTANGNAQISTAKFKFGSSSLLLDGTGDYIENTTITTLGDGSWEISMGFNINALPGSGSRGALLTAIGSSAFGARVMLFNNAGTTKLELRLSSNGTSEDIAAAVVGANTTWTLNQWNKMRLVFDALAGTYKLYLSLNGAAETADISVSSTSRVCALARIRLGVDDVAGSGFNGNIDAFRFIRAATNTSAETPSASAPAITDHKVHFFSIPAMQMYEVTAASLTAGVNPTLTAVNRVFVGEADTGAATVSAVRSYALRGSYLGDTVALAVSTAYTINHNLGVYPRSAIVSLVCLTSENGWQTGDELPGEVPNYGDGTNWRRHTLGSNGSRNKAFVSTDLNPFSVSNRNAATYPSATMANWKFRVQFNRGW